MSSPYTPKVYVTDHEVYAAIKHFIAERGHSPSLRDLGSAVGLKSISTVRHHLVTLRVKGLIDWEDRANRTVRIIRDWPTLPTGDVA